MTRSLLEYSCTAFFLKTTQTPSVSLPHWGAHLANMLLQNTFSLVLLPQTEQLRNCTRRWRDFSRGRRKRHINLKKERNKTEESETENTNEEDVAQRRSRNEDFKWATAALWHCCLFVFFSVFTCSKVCPPPPGRSGAEWKGLRQRPRLRKLVNENKCWDLNTPWHQRAIERRSNFLPSTLPPTCPVHWRHNTDHRKNRSSLRYKYLKQ